MDYSSPIPVSSFQKLASSQILYFQRSKTPKFIKNYILGDVIGEGSYGKVKEGFNIQTCERVAVKIMKIAKLQKIPNGLQNANKEINLLKRLEHPNVIKLIDVLRDKKGKKIYMVMEYCETGLQNHLDDLAMHEIHGYFGQILDGLSYLHSVGVMHKDIKPGNILIASSGTVKICDFGVTEQLLPYTESEDSEAFSGSPAFQSPEVAKGNSSFNGFKVDSWAAGVTLYRMVSGYYPFDGENIYNLFKNIAKCEYTLPPGLDPLLENLILGLMMKDPDARLTIEQAKRHPWMATMVAGTALRRNAPLKPQHATEEHLPIAPYLENLFFSEDGDQDCDDGADDNNPGSGSGRLIEIKSKWIYGDRDGHANIFMNATQLHLHNQMDGSEMFSEQD